MTISERVYEILNDQKKSQIALAEYLGLARSSVNYWFKKGGDIPSAMILPISTFLGVSPNYILTGVPDPELSSVPVDSSLTDDEAELVRLYRLLDREGKTMVLSAAYQHKNRILSAGKNEPVAAS